MDEAKIEAMVTKFSEKFAIIMIKKHRKFCRLGLTNLDATPNFQKSSKYLCTMGRPVHLLNNVRFDFSYVMDLNQYF
jgi:hypothetical protein